LAFTGRSTVGRYVGVLKFGVGCVLSNFRRGTRRFFFELVTEVIGLPTAGLLGIPIVGLVTGVAGLMIFPA